MIEPMEARSVEKIPVGDEWQYEPKWDGFRCLLERHGRNVSMTSKSGQDLARYFPEVTQAALNLREKSFSLDGELVVAIKNRFSFDSLLQRIHPAASRITRLSAETPALFLAFDLLKRGRKELTQRCLLDRRAELVDFAQHNFGQTLFRLSPATRQLAKAKKWLQLTGGGSDGVVAKRVDLPYQFGNREGMQKIKRYRSADCVIGGFRYGEKSGKQSKLLGSLLLGLYDNEGQLHHVGFTSGIKATEKAVLTAKLHAIITTRSFTGNVPGGPSRWSTKRSSQWVPVKPKFVVEVSYDHFTGGRFRHGTTILRWRPDKKPKQCTMTQLRQKVAPIEKLLSDRLS